MRPGSENLKGIHSAQVTNNAMVAIKSLAVASIGVSHRTEAHKRVALKNNLFQQKSHSDDLNIMFKEAILLQPYTNCIKLFRRKR